MINVKEQSKNGNNRRAPKNRCRVDMGSKRHLEHFKKYLSVCSPKFDTLTGKTCNGCRKGWRLRHNGGPNSGPSLEPLGVYSAVMLEGFQGGS